MARPTKSDGQTLPAADWNTVVDQSIIECTSTTRPSSPHEGMTIYETDTDKFLTWNGVSWTAEWNDPWGLCTPPVSIDADTGDVSDITTIGGLTTAAFTVPANRYHELVLCATIEITTSGSRSDLLICEIDDTPLASGGHTAVFGTNRQLITIVAPMSLSAGSHQIKVRQNCDGGHNAHIVAGPTGKAFLSVKDIGPAGAPA